MNDYMIRATAADAAIRAFAVTSRELVEMARMAHHTTPVMTAALGRLLTAGVMMGSMMKGDQNLLTIQIRGDGPAKSITVTADSRGNVKGFAARPLVDLPLSAKGKLDVGAAVGQGTISVIKDLGMKEPYTGQCALVTGEIAEDLTYYFASSEQVPSAVSLGVLVNRDCSVCQAGGFIIQLMPYATEEIIELLENNIQHTKAVTELLSIGKLPEQILEDVLHGMNPEITDRMPVQFRCDCSKERVARAIAAIQKKELDSIINDGKDIEVKCEFCGKAYTFCVDEIKEICHKARECDKG